MSRPQSGFIPTYNSLTDKHLAGYFSNTRMRRHLQRSGLISRSGRIISEKEYQRNEVRKNHLRHLKETLTRTIFFKILDLKRRQQLEWMKKPESSVRMEKWQKLKMEHSRKLLGGGTPAFMPHPPNCRRNHHGLDLSVPGEPAGQSHLGERIGVKAKENVSDRCLPRLPLGGDSVMPVPHPPGPKDPKSTAALKNGMPRWRQVHPITAPDGQLSTKMEHFRKLVGGGIPIYMPHPPSCARNHHGLHLSVPGEPAAQSHLRAPGPAAHSSGGHRSHPHQSKEPACSEEGERIGVKAKESVRDRCLPRLPLGGDSLMPVPHPPGPKEPKSAAALKNGMPRWRQVRPITAPDGQLSTKSSGGLHRPSVHPNVLITMVFLGKNLQLAHPDTQHRDEVRVYQLHCGGRNHCVYTGMLLEKGVMLTPAWTKSHPLPRRKQRRAMRESLWGPWEMECRMELSWQREGEHLMSRRQQAPRRREKNWPCCPRKMWWLCCRWRKLPLGRAARQESMREKWERSLMWECCLERVRQQGKGRPLGQRKGQGHRWAGRWVELC
ncbi:glutamate rich 3-like isoform X3 [Melanerpes formicivorus]|uniref:glutamate rich 3-like isoform X3 n=1 Tax=Melanerpes formicivorus TaxID=211600 RepID=UPI00358F0921